MIRELRKGLFSLLGAVIFFTQLQAQDRQISGKVSDEKSEALPGANIVIKGTTKGTNSDADGKYSIGIGSAGTLVFSALGYKTKEVTITNSMSVVDMKMEPDAKNLDEVVVTALGITKDQKTLSYATQKINTDNFSKARELNVANSLAGRVAGLDIARAGSGVGGSTRVVLRGDRSITGNNQALIVVDGVPIDNTNFGVANAYGGRDGSDALSAINPDDIESINVLRGASATALYGSRASNGAMLITTKKGKPTTGIGITVNSSFQMERAMMLRNFQNVYGQGINGQYIASQEASWGPKMTGQSVGSWGPDPANAGKTYAYSPQPYNYKDFFETGNSFSKSVSLTGEVGKLQTYFSYSNITAKGIVGNNKLQRNNFNLRLSSQVNSRLSFDTRVTYLNEKINNRQTTGDDFSNVQRHIARIPRSMPLDQVRQYEYIDPLSGNLLQNYWNPGSNGGENPYWIENRVLSVDTRDRIYGFAAANYKVLDWLTIMGRVGYDMYVDKYEGKLYNNTYTIADRGNFLTGWRQNNEMNLDLIALIDKKFNQDLKLSATVGANSLSRNLLTQTSNNNGLLRQNLFIPTNAVNQVVTRDLQQTRKQGVYASADLIYKDAITLSATARNDWSSTLPAANRSYFFPSIGASAVLTSLLDLPEAISFAKVRGTYALTGNDAAPYLLTQTYTFSTGGTNGFLFRDPLQPFPGLKPELTTSQEFGLEMKFMDNRFGFDLTLYNTNSKNQLIPVTITPTSGWSTKYINAGNVNNKGLELMLNFNPIKTDNFSWNIDLNYAKNVNKLITLAPGIPELNVTQDFMNVVKAEEGKPLGQVYSKGFVRDTQGRIVVDATGLPMVTTDQSVRLGSSRPKWTGGISNRFNYKSFNSSFLISGRIGGIVSSFTNAVTYSDGVTAETVNGRESMIVDGVQADGSKNTIATTAQAYWQTLGGRNSPAGEAFTYSASNIRLREFVLGYKLPIKAGKSVFQSVTLSVVGRNLFFLMNKAKGFDPEIVAGSTNTAVGLEAFSPPSTRTYGVNLNLSF